MVERKKPSQSDPELCWLIQKRIEGLAKKNSIRISTAKPVPISLEYICFLLDSVEGCSQIDDYLLQQARLAAEENERKLAALRITIEGQRVSHDAT